jgi:hypothetical protein
MMPRHIAEASVHRLSSQPLNTSAVAQGVCAWTGITCHGLVQGNQGGCLLLLLGSRRVRRGSCWHLMSSFRGPRQVGLPDDRGLLLGLGLLLLGHPVRCGLEAQQSAQPASQRVDVGREAWNGGSLQG